VYLETTRQAAEVGKHVFLDKPIANSVSDGRNITECWPRRRRCACYGLPTAAGESFPLDQAADRRRCFGKLVNVEANISRDRY
jgi:predicted dehydrogenase